MTSRSELAMPHLVAIFPRYSRTVSVNWKFLDSSFAIALSQSKEESLAFRQAWPDEDLPLLILTAPADEHLDLVQAVLSIQFTPNSTIGVLLFDGPDLPKFGEIQSRHFNEELSRSLCKIYKDLQVVEYSDSWRTSPPRLR